MNKHIDLVKRYLAGDPVTLQELKDNRASADTSTGDAYEAAEAFLASHGASSASGFAAAIAAAAIAAADTAADVAYAAHEAATLAASGAEALHYAADWVKKYEALINE